MLCLKEKVLVEQIVGTSVTEEDHLGMTQPAASSEQAQIISQTDTFGREVDGHDVCSRN